MNPLKLLARFTAGLLSYDEQLIRIGRNGFKAEDFSVNYIVVDSIGPAIRISRGSAYDGDAEVQTLYHRWQSPCTLNFYGDDAYDNAQQFALMLASQSANDLQKEHSLTVYRVASLTDVKVLTGQQYGNNIELQLNIEYNQSIDLDVLRIDSVEIEFNANFS